MQKYLIYCNIIIGASVQRLRLNANISNGSLSGSGEKSRLRVPWVIAVPVAGSSGSSTSCSNDNSCTPPSSQA